MNFINYGKDDVYYEHINRTILDINVSNLSLVICKGNFGAIYSDNTSCHSTILSYLPLLHITFNKALIYIDNLFPLEKLFLKAHIFYL